MTTHLLTSMSKIALVTISIFSLASCVIVDVDSKAQKSKNSDRNIATQSPITAPKNIIMVVADGMGPAYVSAYRYYMDNPATEMVETTVFDDILVGTSRTYPAKQSGVVTDSAASATAMATGVKSYNGAIGMDVNKQPLETVLHRAHKLGLKTGLAVTSHIVHATPASYMVANEARGNYAQIADSFYDDRINGDHLADIMLGAGWSHFIREDRNLVELFEADGYQYIDSYDQLSSINPSVPVLGLFGDDSLPWALDDTDPERLHTLTKAIVPYLDADTSYSGYFLLLEASQVDWAGHGNDIASAMAEMDDLAKTMEYLVDYVENHPETLVILTADHSTGGLTIGADGDYRWDSSFIKGFKKSIPSMASEINEQSNKGAYLSDMFGFALSEEETDSLSVINSDMAPRAIQKVLKAIIDSRTNTGWTTSGHTGVDVDVFAFGPSAQVFAGNQNNTDIAEKIFTLLEKAH
ncbi:MAG: alkaline phosphatase [Alphaproteobacteria bacterium]|jgi:alkaline phosphatase